MREATEPFEFMHASILTRVCGVQATTIAELLAHVRRISPDSVFHHTFQTLGEHHFLTEGFSNDFAQWLVAACNAPELAEHVGALDIRQYESIEALRTDLVTMLEGFVGTHAERAYWKAFGPFFFCESVTVTVPSEWRASTLVEFCDALRHVSIQTVYYHFVTARLRGPTTNDFSAWIEGSLHLADLADRIDRIDIYTNTLEGVRCRILEECQPSLET